MYYETCEWFQKVIIKHISNAQKTKYNETIKNLIILIFNFYRIIPLTINTVISTNYRLNDKWRIAHLMK